MKTKIIGKNVTVTEGMRTKIENMLEKLEKYDFFKENTVCNVLVRTVKDDQIIEITIPLEHKKMIRVERRSNDLYEAIDLAEESLARQIRKLKEKNRDKKRHPTEEKIEEECVNLTKNLIVKDKKIPAIYLTPEEACDEMEALDHDFHLFMNTKTDTPCVIYKRKDGNYGLISF